LGPGLGSSLQTKPDLCKEEGTVRSFKAALATLVAVLFLGWVATPVCFSGDVPEFAETNGARSNSRTVLVIPGRDCQIASFVLAKVTRHIRDAERSALYSAAAEDEYDDGLQAVIEGNCAKGIEHLRTSDRALQQNPTSEFFMLLDGMR
jgi:hypothetical protein